jgi:hypothetical protein
MRRLLPLLLLLTACASPTAVIDKRHFKCGPGQDLSIAAGFDPAAQSEVGEPMFLVEVSNNTHNDVTVKTVRVGPANMDERQFGSAQLSPDVTISGGDAEIFRLPARRTASMIDPRASSSQRSAVDFDVYVALTNGDSYQCQFRAAVR